MAAKINWVRLRRLVKPQCQGGMLMLSLLLIKAQRTGNASFHNLAFKILIYSVNLKGILSQHVNYMFNFNITPLIPHAQFTSQQTECTSSQKRITDLYCVESVIPVNLFNTFYLPLNIEFFCLVEH